MDAEFTDGTGDKWRINLTVGLIEDIKDEAGVDLDGLMKKPTMLSELVMTEPKQFVMMMYVICKDKCIEKNISARDFGKRFGRETLDASADAFIKALLLFYPRQSGGKVVAENLPALLAKMDKEVEETTRKKIQQVLSS